MRLSIYFIGVLSLLTSCIGNDILEDTVAEEIKITDRVDTLGLNDTYQFLARYTDQIGRVQDASVNWNSSSPTIVSIDANGLATGLSVGEATVYVELNEVGAPALQDSVKVKVGTETVEPPAENRSGLIQTTTFYELTGDFEIEANGDDIIIKIADNYKASSTLPGLYLYLTNNPNSITDAVEVSKVTTFSGEHEYEVADVGLNDYDYLLYYCKPFNVKVGDGEIQ
ncbi:MAG: DM13 domain-containing protein [Bacteroidota bacterium]